MKLSDRELVAITYALNMVLGELSVDVKSRSKCVLFAATKMCLMKGELEDLSNYSEAAKELRRMVDETEAAVSGIKAEILTEMSDA